MEDKIKKRRQINLKSYHKNKTLKRKTTKKLCFDIENYENYFVEGGLEEIRKWFYEEVIPELNKHYIKYKKKI